MSSNGLRLEGLRVEFGKVAALDGIDLDVVPGELAVLLGPSGCGKTTTLNAVAGVVRPTAGRIRLGDKVLADAETRAFVAPNRRNLGMVFQSYALWPHLTVGECVAFPLRMRHVPREQRRERVMRALSLLQCEQLVDRYPAELSGGQQQRVALGRAIVGEPDVLLFDEPLSNLDAKLRESLRAEIAKLHQRLGFTGLYVTHDRSEAFALGTSLVVMAGGRILQVGSPRDVYERPASLEVADFLGAVSFAGTVTSDDSGARTVLTPFGALPTSDGAGRGAAMVAVHPDRLRVRPADDGPAVVSLVRFLGTRWEYSVTAVDSGEEVLVARPMEEPPIAEGTRVALVADPASVKVFAAAAPAAGVAAPGDGGAPVEIDA